MKVLVLIAFLTAALAPHSIAAVVASSAGAATCKKDAPDAAVFAATVATQSATQPGKTRMAK